MKKILAVILALAMTAGTLVGCGIVAANEGETTASGVTPEKTVVTLTAAYDLPGFEAAFEAAYPDTDLQIETMATALINGEVARRLRNGHGSDIIITNLPAGEISEYTYDLSTESFVESYQSSITKSITVEGQNRYLPLPGAYYGYIINKTLLDELGLALPETKEDLLSILAAAKEQNVGVSPDTGCGFGLSDTGATFIGAYMAADFAADFLSTADGIRWLAALENGEATFSESWGDSVAFLKTCVDEGYIDPNKIIVNYNGHLDSNSNAFKAEVALPERTAILSYGNIDMLNRIQSKTEDEIVMLPCLPTTAEGNKLLSAVSNDYIAVNKAIENDETKLNAALSVLEYLSTVEGQAAWIADTECYHSYLNGYAVDTESLPESIRSYAEEGMVFSNPFATNLLSYLGKSLASAAKGGEETAEALAQVDDYYVNGSEDVEYDMSIVGTVASDMLYENANTRVQETELGNFISDAIREVTGADVVLVNGGGIRSSLYAGDVTGDDLSCVCPYGNLIILVELDGATLRAAITNGIQKTWKPAGQFLQVSGIRYSFKPAADETETAELVSLTYEDGTEIRDEDIMTVAYTNYMGGSGGYVDAGDGFTMLNVYDADTPVSVTLVEETNKTYGDALKEYFAAHMDEEITATLEGRIEVIQ